MESKIIPFPTAATTTSTDPALERALFLAEHDWTELRAVVPQAAPSEPKAIY